MWPYRLIYMMALVCSAIFYILYPLWFSWYLLIMILLLIPLDLLVSIPGMLTKRVTIMAPEVLEKGADGAIIITTYQRKRYPAGRIKLVLYISGIDSSSREKIICDPEGGSRYLIGIDTLHSGVTVFAIKRIRNTSLIGLFSLAATINSSVKVMVIPAPLKPPNIVSLPRGVILKPKPGGGYSEESELRPYRAGDPIRIIHWKLSAKHDSLVIREPLVPADISRLVHVTHWSDEQERDTILGRLRWLSNYLLKWEQPFFVRLEDSQAAALITQHEMFVDYLFCVLQGNMDAMQTSVSLPARFSWVFRIDARTRGDGIA